jgi:drug/metabolite transporter (DMT)-like permease
MYAVYTALGIALITLITRKLKEVETSSLMLGHSIVGWFLYSVIIAFAQGFNSFNYQSNTTYIYLIIGGIANCTAQYAWTFAAQRSNATLCVLLKYSGVFYSFLVDLFVFR